MLWVSGNSPVCLSLARLCSLNQHFVMQTLVRRPFIIANTASHNAERATREEMSAARLPLQYRDSCAHLLIPLNRCRFEEWYLPWKCEVRRMNKMCKRWVLADGSRRRNDIHTRSASMRSSKSELLRWMKYGQQRAEREVIEVLTHQCLLVGRDY